MWTLFWDMHSGGKLKEKKWGKIYIEAPEEEAKVIFYNRFGHNPERVTCTCCGKDYSIDEDKTFKKISEFHRDEGKLSIELYKERKDVLIISKKDILPEEKKGKVPQQGYVWVD